MSNGIYQHSKDGRTMAKAALITDLSVGVKHDQFQNIRHIVVACSSFANLLMPYYQFLQVGSKIAKSQEEMLPSSKK